MLSLTLRTDWTTEQHLSLPIRTWSCRKSQLPGLGWINLPPGRGCVGWAVMWAQAHHQFGFRHKQPLVTADLWGVALYPHLFLQPAPGKKRGDAEGDTLRYPWVPIPSPFAASRDDHLYIMLGNLCSRLSFVFSLSFLHNFYFAAYLFLLWERCGPQCLPSISLQLLTAFLSFTFIILQHCKPYCGNASPLLLLLCLLILQVWWQSCLLLKKKN